VYARPAMSRPRRPAASRFLGLLLVVALCLLAACSRQGAIGDESDAAATSTVTSESTTTSPPATQPTDSSVAGEDPNASSTTEPSPDDDVGAFGHTDADLASFRAAYSVAFEAECRRIWSTYAGADGLMADPDFPDDTYTVDDCLFELDADYGEFADSVEEAQTTGLDDAQIAASDMADPLCATAGSPCWSYGDS
jgi:hypothetical protein